MISVIIPIYKAEKYLHRCIDSVLAQTYEDLEVILVDDGSPDSSGAICDEYAAKDNRVKVIHQANKGVSTARNAGMSIAVGEYISFIDSDDYIDIDMYAQLAPIAEQTNADMVECNYRYGRWDNEDTDKVYTNTGMEALEKMFMSERYGDGYSVSPCTKLFFREALKDIAFLPECSVAEDALFITQLLCKAKKVVKIDKTFYTYYMSEISAMRGNYTLRRCDEVIANKKILEVVEHTENRRLIHFLQGRYLGLIEKHWHQCYQLRDQKEFKGKATELWCLFKREYQQMKHALSRSQKLKYFVFRASPFMFYKARSIYAALKG